MSAIDIRDRELTPLEQVRLNDVYREDLAGVLIPQDELRNRVDELGSEITERYRDNPDFYPICILKGAIRFFVDLLRNLDLDVAYSEGVVHSSRYHGGPDIDRPAVEVFQEGAIAGKDVLLVEDILDEGYTLATLRNRIEEFDPNSLRVVTLLDTAVDRDVDIDPAYTGFRVPDAFYVGYGLDYDERYRDLRHLGVLDRDVLEE
jgi:hypoxanthine phosphoribosyltransferase